MTWEDSPLGRYSSTRLNEEWDYFPMSMWHYVAGHSRECALTLFLTHFRHTSAIKKSSSPSPGLGFERGRRGPAVILGRLSDMEKIVTMLIWEKIKLTRMKWYGDTKCARCARESSLSSEVRWNFTFEIVEKSKPS